MQRRFATVGLNNHIKGEIRTRAIMINQLNGALLIGVPLLGINCYLVGDPVALNISIAAWIGYAFTFLTSVYQNFKASLILSIFIGLTSLNLLDNLYGPELGCDYAAVVYMTFGIYFSKDTRLAYFFTGYYVLLQLVFVYLFPDLLMSRQDLIAPANHNIFLFLTLFGCLLITYYIHMERKRYTGKVQDSLSQLVLQNQKLKVQRREIIQKNEDIAQMTNVAAHNLRTPLRSIQGFTQLLSQEKPQSAQKEEYAEIIKKYISQMNHTLDGVIHYFSAPDVQKSTMFDISQTIRRAYENINSKAPLAQITIEGNSVSINGDQDSFEILIGNILENSFQYNNSGIPLAEITILKIENQIRIDIVDNGVGVSPEYFQEIFQLFSRLDHHNQSQGIGLAITKKIIESMGGDIKFIQIEKGAHVQINIPFEENSVAEITETQKSDWRFCSFPKF